MCMCTVACIAARLRAAKPIDERAMPIFSVHLLLSAIALHPSAPMSARAGVTRPRATLPRLGLAEVAEDIAGAVDTTNIVKAQSNMAWKTLEMRIANSRIGPIVTDIGAGLTTMFQSKQKVPVWATALWDSVYRSTSR